MSKIRHELSKFKLELAPEWKALLTHKYRRPAWVKFPVIFEDPRWVQLSDRAAKTMVSIFCIAAENPGASLPETEALYRRLRSVDHCSTVGFFMELINELNQRNFLTRTTPELQSTELQSTDKKGKGEEEKQPPVDSCGEDSTNIQIEGLGEEVRIEESGPDKPDCIAHQNLNAPETSEFVPRDLSAPDRSARLSLDELKAKYGENWGLDVSIGGEGRR